MKSAPIPANESQRLEALRAYNILDTQFEQKFNDLVNLAAQICEVPMALISLIDENRQWFKASYGLDTTETSRDLSFCAHAILQDDLFVVPDSINDDRFANNPLVTGAPNIRFYAGSVLTTPEGHNIGTICALDRKPRELTETQKAALRIISRQTIELFELHKFIQQNQKTLNELHETQSRYEEAERIAKIGSWELDFKTMNVKWSREHYRLFEVDRYDPSLIRAAIRDKFHPDDLHKLEWVNEQVRLQENFEIEHRIVLKDGSIRHISSQGEFKFDENGKPTQLIGTAQDVTEKKKLFEALEAQRAKVISSSKMASLGEMAGGIAHEINNPLTIIKAKASQLIKKFTRGEIDVVKISHDLLKIEQTVDRIAKIVNSMRTISRNADCDNMEEYCLHAAINDALELCGEKFRNHHVQLINEVPDTIVLEGRAVQISQVVLNLLSNAYDAIVDLPNEKWIRINVEETKSGVRLMIADSGEGISPTIRENIMNPFFTTKEVGKGTGLGLSISHGIIQAHQGRLFYDTKANNTTFVIELPRHPLNAKKSRAS